MTDSSEPWFGVRCVFRHGPIEEEGTTYEERVTLWQAASFAEAIAAAEAEAVEYAALVTDAEYLGLAQAYELPEPPGHGAEVFSLIRDSERAPEQYLTTFFETGRERQQIVD